MVWSDFLTSCLHLPLLCEISCETRARHDQILPKQPVSTGVVYTTKSTQNVVYQKSDRCMETIKTMSQDGDFWRVFMGDSLSGIPGEPFKKVLTFFLLKKTFFSFL